MCIFYNMSWQNTDTFFLLLMKQTALYFTAEQKRREKGLLQPRVQFKVQCKNLSHFLCSFLLGIIFPSLIAAGALYTMKVQTSFVKCRLIFGPSNLSLKSPYFPRGGGVIDWHLEGVFMHLTLNNFDQLRPNFALNQAKLSTNKNFG